MKQELIKNLKKDFKKILEEVQRRVKGKHTDYNIAGVEIRMRRNAMSLTLAELAENICSISYLCKVEQSQIKPNMLSLNDICSKLDIDDESLNVLMSLDKVLIDMVNAYFENDLPKMKKIYLSGKGLENYRYKIIELIYHIANNEYLRAFEIGGAIRSLVSALSDIDLVVFAIFYDILNFKQIDPADIYKELGDISKIIPLDETLIILINILKIKCLFVMNSPLVVKRIEELSNDLLRIARFDMIDEIRYLEAIYFLYNHEMEGFESIKKLVGNKSLAKNLEIYKKILANDHIYTKDLASSGDYAYCLGLAKIEPKKALEIAGQKLADCNLVEYDETMVEYQTLNNSEAKYNFILFVVMPAIKASKNKIIAKFYSDELLKITLETNKYKLYYQFMAELNS